MVNRYVDRKSSKSGCGTPSKWPFMAAWLIHGGDPNYFLLTGMIPQVSCKKMQVSSELFTKAGCMMVCFKPKGFMSSKVS